MIHIVLLLSTIRSSNYDSIKRPNYFKMMIRYISGISNDETRKKNGKCQIQLKIFYIEIESEKNDDMENHLSLLISICVCRSMIRNDDNSCLANNIYIEREGDRER